MMSDAFGSLLQQEVVSVASGRLEVWPPLQKESYSQPGVPERMLCARCGLSPPLQGSCGQASFSPPS